MDVVVQNSTVVNKICRTCLSGDEPFIELFSANDLFGVDEKINLCDMLVSVAYIEVQSGDGLPDEICQSCAEKATVAYNFKVLCERSDAVLREAGLSDQYIKIEGLFQQELLTNSVVQQTDTAKGDCIQLINSLPAKSLDSELLPSRPMLLVGPDGVRVLPKSEIDSHNMNIMKQEQSTVCNNIIIEEINESIPCDLDYKSDLYREKRKKVLKNTGDSDKLEPLEPDSDGSDCDGLEELCIGQSNGPETFTCIICSQTFKERSDLRAHKKTHPADMRHQCPHCGKSFSRIYTLQHHIVTHFEYRAYLCPVCGKRFHHAGGLRQHVKYHRGVKPHPCQMCDKRYYSLHLLREHTRCAHSDNRYNNTCNVCGKRFTAKSTLTMHMRIHTGERAHPCDICGKRFTRAAYLREHARRHTSQPPARVFCCEYENCTREFATKASLQIHVRYKHTLERPFSCESCFKAFSSQQGLNEHRRTHTGEKPEVCILCDNRFVNKQSLKKHMRLHTGERPYPCVHCDDSFVSASRLNEHVQMKHMERSHECSTCGKKFHLRRTLTAHMNVHKGNKKSKDALISDSNVSNNTQMLETKQNVPEPGFEIIV